MIQYDEKYDSYYDDVTMEWVESVCSDPTCHYCRNRPEKPLGNDPDTKVFIGIGSK